MLDDNQKRLLEAIEGRQRKAVRVLVRSGAPVNFYNPQGLTPLALAAQAGLGEIVKLLLDHGARANQRDQSGKPALVHATESGSESAVRYLLEADADPNGGLPNGSTPLLIAAQAGSDTIVDLLLSAGATPHAYRNTGHTALMVAARSGSVGIVKLLLDYGSRVHDRDFDEKTALIHAVESRSSDTVRVLLKAGANPDARTLKGRTALMYGACHRDLDVLRHLLKRGANPRLVDEDGKSAIDHLSVELDGEVECRSVLKEAGATMGKPTRRTGYVDWIIDPDDYEQLYKMKGLGAAIAILLVPSGVISFAHQDATPMLLAMYASPLAAIWNWPRFRKTTRGVVQFHLLLLAVLVVSWGLPDWAVLALAAPALPLAFPSLIHLSGLLLRTGERPTASLPSDTPSASHTDSGRELAYVSSFLRLSWDSLEKAFVVRRRVKRSQFVSHALSAGLAVALLTLFLVGLFKSSTALTVLLIAAPLGTIGFERLLRFRRVQRVQEERDQIARDINQQGLHRLTHHSQPVEGFCLYLRTFGVTGKLIVGGVDIETVVASALTQYVPVIALGSPGEHFGAGRVETRDEEWKTDIVKLMRRSKLIMVIPSHRPGTLWEMSKLKQASWLEKTVFVMPPEIRFEKEWYSTHWNRTVAEASATAGISLPSHYRRGLLFKLDHNGHLVDHAAFQADQLIRAIGRGTKQITNPWEIYGVATSTPPESDGDWADSIDSGGADGTAGLGPGGYDINWSDADGVDGIG